MSEDPKLFDAGDYNLFRYCHNDPIDNVDPMGLADERREPWYNHEEQAKQLANLQNLLNQKLLLGYGAISLGGLQYAVTQLQQTMGVSVTGQVIGRADPRNAPLGNQSDPNAPSKLEILPDKTKDRGTYKLYHLQLETAKGKPLTGSGYAIEHVTNKETTGHLSIVDFRNTNGVPIAFRRGGEIVDRVGLLTRPSPAASGNIINRQAYEVIYGGFRYPISSVFEQRIHVQNGFVSPALVPIGF